MLLSLTDVCDAPKLIDVMVSRPNGHPPPHSNGLPSSAWSAFVRVICPRPRDLPSSAWSALRVSALVRVIRKASVQDAAGMLVVSQHPPSQGCRSSWSSLHVSVRFRTSTLPHSAFTTLSCASWSSPVPARTYIAIPPALFPSWPCVYAETDNQQSAAIQLCRHDSAVSAYQIRVYPAIPPAEQAHLATEFQISSLIALYWPFPSPYWYPITQFQYSYSSL